MNVLTTGQVAKICRVAPRTVSKWFDSGRLKGYRIPGSQDRRIPYEYLEKFLKEHGMTSELAAFEVFRSVKVLLLSQDQELTASLSSSVEGMINQDGTKTKLYIAGSTFDATALFQEYFPRVVIVDFSIGSNDAEMWTIDSSTPNNTTFIVLFPEHFSSPNLLQRNLAMLVKDLHVFKKPVELTEIVNIISTTFTYP